MSAYADQPYWNRDRLVAAAGAVVVQALVGWALITGLTVRFPHVVDVGLKLFVAEPPPAPPPRVEPPKVRSRKPEGEASPPNLRSRATEVAAPVPVIVVPPPPPPVVAAPKPFTQSDYMSGSAEVRGPGTGSGGVGDGFGSGGSGDGDGGGYDPRETPPRQTRGGMSTSDIPQALVDAGFRGTVGVRYLVATDGRVPECRVTRSSGSAEVDALTCRLIQQRFRFKPARDGEGRAVPSYIVQNHEWDVMDDPDAGRR